MLTILSIVYSALRAGSSDFFGGISNDDGDGEDSLLPGAELSGGADAEAGNDSDDDAKGGSRGGSYQTGPVSYSYSFFHLIFALASMYLAWTDTRSTLAVSVTQITQPVQPKVPKVKPRSGRV